MFIILINLCSPTPVENSLCFKKNAISSRHSHMLGSLAFCSYLQLSTQDGKRAAKHLGRAVGTDLWSLLLLKIH